MTYLKGLIWQRFEFWLQRMADLNMTDIEKVRVIAQDYLGVGLTPFQCASVQSIMGLQSVVTSYHDASIINEFEKAFTKNPVGMAATIALFMTSARHNITMEIVREWRDRCTKVSLEEKVAAYTEGFGFTENDANRWATYDNPPLDFYRSAGVDSDTFELM